MKRLSLVDVVRDYSITNVTRVIHCGLITRATIDEYLQSGILIDNIVTGKSVSETIAKIPSGTIANHVTYMHIEPDVLELSSICDILQFIDYVHISATSTNKLSHHLSSCDYRIVHTGADLLYIKASQCVKNPQILMVHRNICASVITMNDPGRTSKIDELQSRTGIYLHRHTAVRGSDVGLRFLDQNISTSPYDTIPPPGCDYILSHLDAQYLYRSGKPRLNQSELACYISHIQVLQRFIASSHDYSVVFEDDSFIDLENVPDWYKCLDTLPHHTTFDLCQLSASVSAHKIVHTTPFPHTKDWYYNIKRQVFNMNNGYIITRRGAQCILRVICEKNDMMKSVFNVDIEYGIACPIDSLYSHIFMANQLTVIAPLRGIFSTSGSSSLIWEGDNYKDVKPWTAPPHHPVVRLREFKGRLGNHMFQWAFMKSLERGNAYKIHTPCVNTSDMLTIFNMSETTHNRDLLIYTEPHFHYTDDYKSYLGGDFMVNGYFQAVEYFKLHEWDVKNMYRFRDSTISLCKSILSNIATSRKYPLVALHIRMGDIIPVSGQDPPIYNMSSSAFVNNAFALMKLHAPDCKILIFSDSIDRCKEIYSHPDILFMTADTSPEIGMCLQSMCDHNIISTSTFSWWAAYLNRGVNRRVLCPYPWFNIESNHVKNNDFSGLMFDSWEYYIGSVKYTHPQP